MYRLFIAIDIPETVLTQVDSLCHGLRGANWFTPEQMHITIRFIGEVDGAIMHDTIEALDTILLPPVDIHLKGVGFFPPHREAEKIWAGVEKTESLVQLRNRIESALTRAGLDPEGRKFAPHIPLGKVKEVADQDLAEFLMISSLFEIESFKVNSFSLYSSFLGTEGAYHTQEAEFPLNQNKENYK